MSDEALKVMRSYSWPGNVRQLANALERALVLKSDEDSDISLADLPPELMASGEGPTVPAVKRTLGEMIAALEREGMVWNWNIFISVSFLFSVSVCLAYVFRLVLMSRDPAYWARRAVIPIALIALPFGMVLRQALLEDMKPRPAAPRCTADC